jgi:glycosyltransferase involved in cell wall biosynthesis
VVHLVLTLNIGGLEKVVYDLVRFADRDAFSMRVICLQEIGELGTAFEVLGVPVENLALHGKGPIESVMAASRRLQCLRPDVLHTHNPAAHIVGALAARLSHVPVVVHTRHGMHEISGWKNILGNRLATRLTDRMLAVSGRAADVSRKVDRVAESKLEVIHNGVDLNLYRTRFDRSAGAVTRAIHVARLDYPTKDQRTLLRAIRMVVDRRPAFSLDIVGDGPDRPMLEALRDDLQLRRSINFLGARTDVHKLLPEADLFVLSSTTEGLPMTILEAMAAGLPVVSTDVGGIAEVVAPGRTGLLVPPQSPGALAAAILELVNEPQRAVTMGLAARRRVEEKFDVRVVAAGYEDVYRRLLREAHR